MYFRIKITILETKSHGRPVTMKTGGHINKTGRAQYKSGGVPMVKIKDFTLASQNREGGGARPPVPYRPTQYTQGAHAKSKYKTGLYNCLMETNWR